MTLPANDAFEIAIVSLSKESTEAIQALLDDEYDDGIYNTPDDDNEYITGRLSRTNIILVKDSFEWTALSSTDNTPLLPSFPNIRVILDVGVCGAAPRTKNDKEILVGDAIISHTLWQYKEGKRWPEPISEEDTLQRGSAATNEGGTKLRSFLRALSTYHRHAILETNTATWMKELCDDPVFDIKDPDRSEDRLHPRVYIHKHRTQECNLCKQDNPCIEASQKDCEELKCSIHRVIPRQRHAEGRIGSSIHFGTIIQDYETRTSAIFRDELGVGTIGAVGFIHDNPNSGIPLPTVFIKGVADYADGHKLEYWHEYAAYVAASCTKALIEGWNPISGGDVRTPSPTPPLSPWDGTNSIHPVVSPLQIRHSFDNSRTGSRTELDVYPVLKPELEDFAQCLVIDGTMNRLFTIAFRESMNSQEVLDNFTILLRNYALKLRDEAQNKIEVEMADNVFWEASVISDSIRLKWNDPSNTHADDSQDSSNYFSMSKIKTFMLECRPFLELQNEFELYVVSAKLPEKIPQGFPADDCDPFSDTYGNDSWSTQLTDLGYDPDQLSRFASELKTFDPWILIEAMDKIPDMGPIKQDFHVPGCAHEPLLEGGKRAQIFTSLNKNMLSVEIRHKIERTCGLAGVLPVRGSEQEWFEEVRFSDVSVEIQLGRNSGPTWRRDCLGTRLIEIMDRCIRVLRWAQDNDFCCDAYTTLRITGDKVEIIEIRFAHIYQFYSALVEFDNTTATQGIVRTKARKLLGLFYGEPFTDLIGLNSTETDAVDFLTTIAAQSCSLSILLYFHAHCGPLKMSMLTQEIKTIYLKCPGLKVRPRIRTVWLSCIGDMLKRPVMAFSAIDLLVPKESTTFNLRGTMRNVIYTWGPARILTEAQVKSPQVLLVWMQSGTIRSSPDSTFGLHWSEGQSTLIIHTVGFGLDDITTIGATSPNKTCTTTQLLLSNTPTISTEWEGQLEHTHDSTQGALRQLGFNAHAQYAIYLAHTTSLTPPGSTVKAGIVRDFEVQEIRDSDLEAPWGLRVSFCSGVCERVSLRKALADNIELFGKHCQLASQYTNDWYDLVAFQDLRRNFSAIDPFTWRQWFEKLGSHLKGILNDALCYTISRLSATGYIAGKFVIARPSSDNVARCVKIPCEASYLWMKALADDEYCATFAYFTPICIERVGHSCHAVDGPGHSCQISGDLKWNSSIVGSNTSVGFSSFPRTFGLMNDSWRFLKKGKFYAIGKPQLGLCALATCGNCLEAKCTDDCFDNCIESHLIIKKWQLSGKLRQVLAEYCRLIGDNSDRLWSTKVLVFSSQRPQNLVNGVNEVNGINGVNGIVHST